MSFLVFPIRLLKIYLIVATLTFVYSANSFAETQVVADSFVDELNTISLRNGENGYYGTQDTYLESDRPDANHGNASRLLADGYDYRSGELVILIKWDLSTVPPDATITKVEASFKVYNDSSGKYKFYTVNNEWTEDGASWRSIMNASNIGEVAAIFYPRTEGTQSAEFTGNGVAMIQSWLTQPELNHGFIIRSTKSTDGFDVRSSEHTAIYQRPKLKITYY